VFFQLVNSTVTEIVAPAVVPSLYLLC